jgi:C-terminal processing protease CtpA/Prc
MRRIGWIVLGLLAFPLGLFAQAGDSLGLKLSSVPEVLAEHLTPLPKNSVLVEEAEPGLVGYLSGLRRHDVILSVDGKAWKSSEELLAKLRDGQKKVALSIIRQGKERTLHYAMPSAEAYAKSSLKPGGPPAVSVQAQPQKDGKLNVTIFYYPENSSKLESLNCQAPVQDIERQFHDLATEKRVPEHVQDLVDVALRRLRELNVPKQKN